MCAHSALWYHFDKEKGADEKKNSASALSLATQCLILLPAGFSHVSHIEANI